MIFEPRCKIVPTLGLRDTHRLEKLRYNVKSMMKHILYA